jgi:hypothetical protein
MVNFTEANMRVPGLSMSIQSIVTCKPIVRQRLGKDLPAGADERKNRTSIARQWLSKHAKNIKGQ